MTEEQGCEIIIGSPNDGNNLRLFFTLCTGLHEVVIKYKPAFTFHAETLLKYVTLNAGWKLMRTWKVKEEIKNSHGDGATYTCTITKCMLRRGWEDNIEHAK